MLSIAVKSRGGGRWQVSGSQRAIARSFHDRASSSFTLPPPRPLTQPIRPIHSTLTPSLPRSISRLSPSSIANKRSSHIASRCKSHPTQPCSFFSSRASDSDTSAKSKKATKHAAANKNQSSPSNVKAAKGKGKTKQASINLAELLATRRPSPSAGTAPFPATPDSNSQRAWRPDQRTATDATISDGSTPTWVSPNPSAAYLAASAHGAVPPPSSFDSPITSSTPQPAFFTTPIFYVNGAPHIGHLSTTLVLDALNRWMKISTPTSSSPSHVPTATASSSAPASCSSSSPAPSVSHALPRSWFMSGTDEHGSKVEAAARSLGIDTPSFCCSLSQSFHELFQRADIRLDDYVRTTERRHQDMARAVWQRLHENGWIYLGHHEGYYDRIEEAFVPEKQVDTLPGLGSGSGADGSVLYVDRESGHTLEFVAEKNYKFRLSAFQKALINYLEDTSTTTATTATAAAVDDDDVDEGKIESSDESDNVDEEASHHDPSSPLTFSSRVIHPKSRHNEVLSFLRLERLEDISVSRVRTKVGWGIDLPKPRHLTVNDRRDSQATSSATSSSNTDAEVAEQPDEYQNHVMYVWIDALTNYLTVSGMAPNQLLEMNFPTIDSAATTTPSTSSPSSPSSSPSSSLIPLWPPTLQLIGKDILRFHALYWPAFLMALNMPPYNQTKLDEDGQVRLERPMMMNEFKLKLPRHIVAHSHWIVERRKMSKSLGNVINPFALLDDFGVDSVRYFILRDFHLSSDSNFTVTDLLKRRHADLADTLGNLIQRCTSPAILPNATLPELDAKRLRDEPFTDREIQLLQTLASLPSQTDYFVRQLRFPEALQGIFNFIYEINAFMTEVQPWTIRKKIRQMEVVEMNENGDASLGLSLKLASTRHALDRILLVVLESIRCVAILLQPFIPRSMDLLLWRLGVPMEERTIRHAVFGRMGVRFPSQLSDLPPALQQTSSDKASNDASTHHDASPSSSSSPSPSSPPDASSFTSTSTSTAPVVFTLFPKLSDAQIDEVMTKYSATPSTSSSSNAAATNHGPAASTASQTSR